VVVFEKWLLGHLPRHRLVSPIQSRAQDILTTWNGPSIHLSIELSDSLLFRPGVGPRRDHKSSNVRKCAAVCR
jgi:hypothetical protein